jgi:hypothetical protein
MSTTLSTLSSDQRKLLLNPNHPVYANLDRLRQVLDNIQLFGPVVNIGQFGISFRDGVFQFFSMESKVEDVNDYDYPDKDTNEDPSE